MTKHHRRLPFYPRAAVEAELHHLLHLHLIEPAKCPTPWMSQITVVPKPNWNKEICLCVDMRFAKSAIIREHVKPTIDDILYVTHAATIFSGLDLKNTYHQLELREEYKVTTKFSTNVKLFWIKPKSFGVSSAVKLFHDITCQMLIGFWGTINISDNIFVFGCNTKHYQALKSILKSLVDKVLTLNLSKSEFA